MSANPSNNGTVIGNLAAAPAIFLNKDGSRSINITVFARNNFASKNGEYMDVKVPLTKFYPASKQGNGLFESLEKGDKIAVSYTLRQDEYTDKNGQPIYALVAMIEDIQPLESKATAEERRARKAAADLEAQRVAAANQAAYEAQVAAQMQAQAQAAAVANTAQQAPAGYPVQGAALNQAPQAQPEWMQFAQDAQAPAVVMDPAFM